MAAVTTNVTFHLKEKFSSFDDVQSKIDEYCRKTYIDLYRRDTRTLEAAVRQQKISTDRVKNKSLKFYEVKFACIHGGRNYKARGKGLRSSNTFQMHCPFSISLRLSDDGEHLVVNQVNLTHENHDIGAENYQFYPKVRKLNDDERQYAEDMLGMGANNKKLQQQLSLETGKAVLLKDLSNISLTAKRKHHTTKNDLSQCVKMLRQNYNCAIDISTDENDTFCGLFVQDREMRETFAAYPEILFMDATYKLLDLQFPVYLFVCEDSNGLTEIAGMGMLVTEDAESVKWLIETFKSKNPAVARTRLVMADKDINERDMIKTVLPHLKVLICLFHTLRTFRREVTTEIMGINTGEREVSLEFILKMAYAKTEDEYTGIYNQFSSIVPHKVKAYFDKNWHPIKEEWVMGFKFSIGNFLNTTNNRLESINGKLKQVITKYSSLEYFIEQFFIILPVLRNERNYKTLYSYQKVKVVPHNINSPKGQYTALLTSYASTYVLEQIDFAEKYEYEFVTVDGHAGVFYTTSSQGRIEVSHFRCSCCFFQSMRLPCRHIFSLRQKSGVSWYDKNICDSRWTNTYYRSTHKTLKNLNKQNEGETDELVSCDQNEYPINISSQAGKKKLSSHQKFSKALDVCKKIANVLSHSSHQHFERKLDQLKLLNEAWCEGKEIGIQIFDDLPGIANDVEAESEAVEEAEVEVAITTDNAEREAENVDFRHEFETFDIPMDKSLPLLELDPPHAPEHHFNIINKNVVSSLVASIIDKGVMEEQNIEDLLFNTNPEDYVVREVLTSLVDTVVLKEGELNTQIEQSAFDQELTVKKIKTIKVPPALKKKGRPKGSDKTNVIGLSKPKKKTNDCQKFSEMKTAEKEKFILLLCVGDAVASKVLESGGRVEESDINPTEIDSGVFNEKICLKVIQYLFSGPAWSRFYSFYTDKMEILKFQCAFCLNADTSYEDLITCEHCLKCYHHLCVKLKKSVRKRAAWFCNPCKAKVKSDAVAKSNDEVKSDGGKNGGTNVCDESEDEE